MDNRGREVAAMLNRLEEADDCDDPNQIRMAVQTGRSLVQRIDEADEGLTDEEQALAKLEDGASQIARVKGLVDELACRLQDDADLIRKLELRESARVQIKLQRLWDLLAVQTVQPEGMDWNHHVSLDIYRQFHMRLSVAMAERESAGSAGGERQEDGTFILSPGAMAEAMTGADGDFAADIDRYGEGTHETDWVDQLRSEFRNKCTQKAQALGIAAVINQYDSDCSGALDLEEFVAAVRWDMKVDEEDVSENELQQLFSAVDTDNSGEVDAEEFVSGPPLGSAYGLCSDIYGHLII
jgi:hypothetical protein